MAPPELDFEETEDEPEKVRVVAKVASTNTGTRVFLKTFDVDNPLTATTPFDDAAGDEASTKDNRGKNVPKQGQLYNLKTGQAGNIVKAKVNRKGEGKVILPKIGKEFADNYRVCAACSKEELQDLIVKHPDPVFRT